jgi:hypothetical protein
MKKPGVYCRKLEDNSGFAVCQRIVGYNNTSGKSWIVEKWELCLGLGSTREGAWKEYSVNQRTKIGNER